MFVNIYKYQKNHTDVFHISPRSTVYRIDFISFYKFNNLNSSANISLQLPILNL